MNDRLRPSSALSDSEQETVHLQAAGASTGPEAAPAGYELLDQIGRGGMGVVYRARDLTLKRDVAVKFLQERFAGQVEATKRFVEESLITAQLQHSAIPAIYQVGTAADGRPFLAMKLIRGRALDELLKERAGSAVDRPRFLAVFEQITQAVAYAHSKGIIHSDLKPANVMVGEFGEVQVMDWGLAKSLRDSGAAGAAVAPAEPGVPQKGSGTAWQTTPALSSVRPLTCLPNRHAATTSASASPPMSSGWGPSCA